MGSIVSVDTLQGLTSGQVTLPTGHKIKGTDVGSVIAPGTVIQIQYATYTTSIKTSTNNVWTDTGFYVNITPKYSNSKIWVNVTTTASWAPAVSLVLTDIRRFVAGSQQATSPHTGSSGDGATMGAYGGSTTGAVDNGVPLTIEWFDSPGAISQLTYKLYYKGNGAGLIAIGSAAHSNATTYDIITTVKAVEIAQ